MRESKGHTFETRLLGQMECGMLPADGIFGITPSRCQHFVESRYPVAWSKLGDVVSDCLDNTRDIVALIDTLFALLRYFPILQFGFRQCQLCANTSGFSAMSENVLGRGTFGFEPDTITLVTTWSGPGSGTDESIISTRGPE